jgi:hypothetical protein
MRPHIGNANKVFLPTDNANLTILQLRHYNLFHKHQTRTFLDAELEILDFEVRIFFHPTLYFRTITIARRWYHSDDDVLARRQFFGATGQDCRTYPRHA